MRDAPVERNRIRFAWILVLGVCTLWLVVQNALMTVAMLWAQPGPVWAVGAALIKTAALLITRFWGSWAATLAAVVAVGLAGGAAAIAWRSEVRHG